MSYQADDFGNTDTEEFDFFRNEPGEELESMEAIIPEERKELELIPEGTKLLATIEDMRWKQWEDVRSIKIMWRVELPEKYARRVIFQTISPWDKNPNRVARHRKFFQFLDHHMGTGIYCKGAQFDDDKLQEFVGGTFKITVGLFEEKKLNYVNGLELQASSAKAPPPPKRKPAPKLEPDISDDDIPF